jgi:signal peptide peptidase SppA
MFENVWLGTQASYEVFEAAKKEPKPSDPFGMPSMLDVQNGVGIVSIQGSMIPGSAGFMRMFGAVGYADIQDALLEAVADKGVHAILLNIDSGGGAVAGVNDAAKMIADVNKVKPVVTYTGGTMASAALWLGSSAGKMYSSETAITGSLGVLMVHASRARQLENDGVKVTVIRAGKDKALMNPYEDLTEKALEDAQSKADALYDVFLSHVADSRGMSLTAADAAFGQGREFVGKQAVKAGLIDEIGSFTDAFMYAQSLKSSANKPAVRTKGGAVAGMQADNSAEEGAPMPKPITPEYLAALAAGIDLEVDEAAEAAAKAEADAAAAAKAEADAAAAVVEPTIESLQAELEQAKLSAEAALAESATLKAKVESLEAAQGGLLAFARNSIKAMSVPLNLEASAVADSEVLAEHARVSELFKSKFKVGGVAAAKPDEVEGKPKAALVNPLFVHAVKSSQPK